MKKKNLIVIFISTVLVSTIIYFASQSITSSVIDNPLKENNSIKIATFAVCEREENFTHCKDKLYANCNGTPIEIKENLFFCNGKEYNVENTNLGEAYLPLSWEDPRPANFITAWAAEG